MEKRVLNATPLNPRNPWLEGVSQEWKHAAEIHYANPEDQRHNSDDLGRCGRIVTRSQLLRRLENSGYIECDDIESGQNYEEHFAPEYPVVDVLKGITCKEHDAGAETDQKS